MSPVIERVLPKLDWTLTGPQILEGTCSVLTKAREELDRIGATAEINCTFEKTLGPLAKLEGDWSTRLSSFSFPQYVSPDAAIRTASAKAQTLIDQFYIEKGMREDLYKVALAVKQKNKQLEAEAQRYVDKMLLDFKRNGLALSSETRAHFKSKRERLAELSVLFSQNINEDKTTLLFSKEELDGCSADFLESLEPCEVDGGEKYAVTMKYPDILGVLRMARSEKTRRLLDETNNRRVKQNMDILTEAVKLRHECANMLGYVDHAAYSLEIKMAHDPKLAIQFLEELQIKLKPLAEKELEKLACIKAREFGTTHPSINSWDFHYMNRVLLESEYDVDEEQIKQYFPLENVTTEMLRIYEEVLSLSFELVEDAAVWHPDVKLYAVKDGKSDKVIGHFYLDMFPRDGKYTHAACFDLQPGYLLDGDGAGERQLPAAAMVANFTKPTATKPSLLRHGEVVTFFHELGHAMHDMCSKVRLSRFHGTNVETDFVEAPSQMLENWCWDAEMLTRLSQHYLRKSERLPRPLIDSLVRAQNVNAGLLNLRQIFFGTFDLQIHSAAGQGVDVANLYEQLRLKISMIPQPKQVWPAATFGHMMGGYDAGYYGYLWSQVFSADMFYTLFKKAPNGILDENVGMHYRTEILQPGGSRDGMDSLVAFLGRKPAQEAFLKSLGLE